MSVEESVTRESAAPSGPVVHVRPRLTHVAIFVHDRDKMADFYLNVMGLIKTDAGRGISAPVDLFFMTSKATEHHQFVLVTGRPKEATFSTVQQLSFLVDSLAQLREMHRRATNYGVNDMRSISHGNAWSIYFKDPEANLIEVYMHTPWYVPLAPIPSTCRRAIRRSIGSPRRPAARMPGSASAKSGSNGPGPSWKCDASRLIGADADPGRARE